MKKIVCELCGSNSIVKKDGLYECQHCGTKYTLEEVKKLIGPVMIDRSEEHKNYVKLMEYAYDSGDYASALKYAEQALSINSLDYSTYTTFIKSKCLCDLLKGPLDEAITKISFTLPGAFKNCLAIMKETDEVSVENVRNTIDEFVTLNRILARIAGEDIKKRISETGEYYRRTIIQEYSINVERINVVYDEMVKNLEEYYGEEHEFIKCVKTEWLSYIAHYRQFFTNIDADSVIRHIKKGGDSCREETENEEELVAAEIKKDKEHKKWFFGLF